MPTKGVSQDATPKLGTLSLSRGKAFERVYRVPYIIEPGTEGQIVITDAAGATLATFFGEVGERTITFTEYPTNVDAIPHAANYDFSITYPTIGEPSPIEYGLVVRKEPRFTLLPPADSTETAIKFEANFATSSLLGPKWVIKNGHPKVFVNLPAHSNAVSADWLFFQNSAMLFYAPVNGDDITVNVAVRNPGPGKTTIVVCSDYSMSEWLGVQFETGSSNNYIHMVTGSGPIAMANQGAAVANTVAAETDTYQIKYDSLSDTIRVFKNGSGTALASFTDTLHTIGHGPGHRYWGVNWQGSLLSGGVQVIAINAQDGI